MLKLLSPVFLIILLAHTQQAAHSNEDLHSRLKVIYGQDNRVEADDYHDAAFRDLSDSVAAMVRSSSIFKDPRNPGRMIFPRRTAENFLNLCPDERFAQQITLPLCSGFLVADDLVVTAGHCVQNEGDCKRFKWAFGFKGETTSLAENDVYSCSEIVDFKLEDTTFKLLDYAVIRLDRPVENREPLKYRQKSKAKINQKLVVIGHPMGLPLKIADSAKVSRMNLKELKKPFSSLLKKRYYFLANLDTYGGNSGSPVFNQETREVEGILVEGADDFIKDEQRGCLRSNILDGKRWTTQEKVLRITKIPMLQAK